MRPDTLRRVNSVEAAVRAVREAGFATTGSQCRDATGFDLEVTSLNAGLFRNPGLTALYHRWIAVSDLKSCSLVMEA